RHLRRDQARVPRLHAAAARPRRRLGPGRPLAAAARGGGRDRAGARPRGGCRSHAARRGRGARGVVARSPRAVGTGAARGAVRIAFFFRRLAGPGGAERTMYEEALYCRRHGIETALYTFGLDPSALFRSEEHTSELQSR